MPAAMQGADGACSEEAIGRILLLLREALIILDEKTNYLELGARVQEVIDALEERSLSSSAIRAIQSSSLRQA